MGGGDRRGIGGERGMHLHGDMGCVGYSLCPVGLRGLVSS